MNAFEQYAARQKTLKHVVAVIKYKPNSGGHISQEYRAHLRRRALSGVGRTELIRSEGIAYKTANKIFVALEKEGLIGPEWRNTRVNKNQ